jgi:hypothetical protein
VNRGCSLERHLAAINTKPIWQHGSKSSSSLFVGWWLSTVTVIHPSMVSGWAIEFRIYEQVISFLWISLVEPISDSFQRLGGAVNEDF